MSNHSANLNIMTKAVLSAGDVLHRDFEEIQRLQASLEGAGKLTRKALIRANHRLIYELTEARSNYGHHSTLSGNIAGKDETRKWLISPVSGLENFSRGNPNWVVSLGLEHKGETINSVIYYPCTNELYKVIKGDGAYSRHMKLRVAPIQKVEDFVVAMDFRFENDKTTPGNLEHLLRSFKQIKSTGNPSLDLINLASGKIDGIIAPIVDPIDISPAKLLLIESGGLTYPLNGTEGLLGSGFKGFESFRDLVLNHFE